MKQILIIMTTLLTLSTCKERSMTNDFLITFDTLNMSVEGYLRKAVLFRQNFYMMFETHRKYADYYHKKMIIFNQKTGFVEDVFVPKEIQDAIYYDLSVQNDSVFVQESQFERTNFVLYKHKRLTGFKLAKTRDLKIYQDEFYDIYEVCRGEWGGTIFFKNITTKEGYEAFSSCENIVNKIGNEYYVTDSNDKAHTKGDGRVRKIADPTKLQKSNLDFNQFLGSSHRKGVENILEAEGFRIMTSFVAEKQLFHVCRDKEGTYIGKIENKKMKTIYRFLYDFRAFFNQYLEDGKQLLIFRSHAYGEIKDGLLIIDGKHFKFYHCKS